MTRLVTASRNTRVERVLALCNIRCRPGATSLEDQTKRLMALKPLVCKEDGAYAFIFGMAPHEPLLGDEDGPILNHHPGYVEIKSGMTGLRWSAGILSRFASYEKGNPTQFDLDRVEMLDGLPRIAYLVVDFLADFEEAHSASPDVLLSSPWTLDQHAPTGIGPLIAELYEIYVSRISICTRVCKLMLSLQRFMKALGIQCSVLFSQIVGEPPLDLKGKLSHAHLTFLTVRDADTMQQVSRYHKDLMNPRCDGPQ